MLECDHCNGEFAEDETFSCPLCDRHWLCNRCLDPYEHDCVSLDEEE